MSTPEFGVVAGGFVVVPHDLLDEAPEGSIVLVYISLYRHGHGSREGCWCSQKRLSQESGVYLKGVRKALLWLEERGWVQGDHRCGRTAIYRVITQRHPERHQPRSSSTQVASAPGVRSKPPQGPGSKTTDEQKPTNNNPRTTTPSLPPTPSARERPPKASAKPKGTTQWHGVRVDPATAPLPEVLEQHRQAIGDFWASKRSGSARTAAAFSLLVRNLERIHAKDASAVAGQLEAATQAGWSSITYERWEHYRPRATRPTGSAPHQPYGDHGSRAQANAAEAKRLLDHWDRQSTIPVNAAAALPPEALLEVFPWS